MLAKISDRCQDGAEDTVEFHNRLVEHQLRRLDAFASKQLNICKDWQACQGVPSSLHEAVRKLELWLEGVDVEKLTTPRNVRASAAAARATLGRTQGSVKAVKPSAAKVPASSSPSRRLSRERKLWTCFDSLSF
jgi:hypothetical protein